MSSVVTTSENGLKMKIQRKSQRQIADIENNSLPSKLKNNPDIETTSHREDYVDNKAKKTIPDSNFGKFSNNKAMHTGKNKCKGIKQTKLMKEKKIKKKFDKVAPSKRSEGKESTPEGDTIPFSSSSSPTSSSSFSFLSALTSSPTSTSSSSSAYNTITHHDSANTSNKNSDIDNRNTPLTGSTEIFCSENSNLLNTSPCVSVSSSGKNSFKNKTDKKYNNETCNNLNTPNQPPNYSNKFYNNKILNTNTCKNNTSNSHNNPTNPNSSTNNKMANNTNNSSDNNTDNSSMAHSTQLSLLQKHSEKLICTKTQKTKGPSSEMSPRSISPPSCILSTIHQQSTRLSTLPATTSFYPPPNLYTHSSIHTSTVLSYSTAYSSSQTSSHISTFSSAPSTTKQSKHGTNHSSNHTSSQPRNQPSIHPNIATPPSTPPGPTSLSPFNLPHVARICHDVQTDTHDMAVSTDPDCLGPCEPGTSVVLEGIVWNESDNGILVVNVTWRGKTYVGTLMDSTRHDWAPPRFTEDDLAAPVSQNYHHYYSWTSCSSSSSSSSGSYFQKSKGEDTPGGISNEVRKLRKCRKDAAAIMSQQQHSTSSTHTSGKNSLSGHKALRSFSFDKEQIHNKAGFYECPSFNCLKKFRHLAGLRYHQSHAHSKHKRGRPESLLSYSDNKSTPSKSPSTETQPAPRGRPLKNKDLYAKNTQIKNTEDVTNTNNNKLFSYSPNKNHENKNNRYEQRINHGMISNIPTDRSSFISANTNDNCNTNTNENRNTNTSVASFETSVPVIVSNPSLEDKIQPPYAASSSSAYISSATNNIVMSENVTNNNYISGDDAFCEDKNIDLNTEKSLTVDNISLSASKNKIAAKYNMESSDDYTLESGHVKENRVSTNIDDCKNSEINSFEFSRDFSSSSAFSLSSSTTSFPISTTNFYFPHDTSEQNINSINRRYNAVEKRKKDTDVDSDIHSIKSDNVSSDHENHFKNTTTKNEDNTKEEELNEALIMNGKESKLDAGEKMICEKEKTKVNSSFKSKSSFHENKSSNERNEQALSSDKNDNTCNDATNPIKIISTSTTIITTTSITTLITSNNSIVTNDSSTNQLNKNLSPSSADGDAAFASASVSDQPSTTTYHTLSTSVITTTTLTSTTLINSLDKQDSACNYTSQNDHFQTEYFPVTHNKANGRYDDDAEAIKINKALEESKSEARSKMFDSYYEHKSPNKKFMDNKSRLNDRPVNKETNGKIEAEILKKTPVSISNKEKEDKPKEKIKEKLKEGKKPLMPQGTKPPTPNNSANRKQQHLSSEQAHPSKKPKLHTPLPEVAEAEAFYKSFQSIFGNPPLPMDLFMDPFYRIALMSDPLIFHKNLIEAQTQMAKSLTSGGMSAPFAGMPFSFMNPLFPNDQAPPRAEDAKPVDMSAKKPSSQSSPKVDLLSNRSWPSYLLPPTSSNHFFGPLKDSGSDVTSRPLFDFFNDPNIFNAHKELSQHQPSPSYNNPISSNVSNQTGLNNSSNKSAHKMPLSPNSEYARYYSNHYQSNLNSERMKKYDEYTNSLNTSSNSNTFTYSSQTNKGRVREDSSKKMYSPNFSVSPNKRQDPFKNQISLPSLLSQPFASFDQTSQSQHFQPSSKSHLQSNYNAFSTSSSSTSNFYYPPSQQQQSQSPHYRKLVSPFKSKNSSVDPAIKQSPKMNSFYPKNNYYNNYNQYNNNLKRPTSSSSQSLVTSSSSSFPSSYSTTTSNHPSSISSITKQTNSHHLAHFSTPSLSPYNKYPVSSVPSFMLQPSTSVADFYPKK